MATRGLPTWPWQGTPACDLPEPERLLLDATRAWAQARATQRAPLPAARHVLLTADAAAAAGPLHALLESAVPASLACGCPVCPAVVPTEAALLLACALSQRGARGEALAALLRWLPPPAAYGAMPAALHLGAALRTSGLLLRHCLRDAGRVRAAPR